MARAKTWTYVTLNLSNDNNNDMFFAKQIKNIL